jgi:hypothetical protein
VGSRHLGCGGAEVAAAFRISLAMAGSYMRYALAMRKRLPQVPRCFAPVTSITGCCRAVRAVR